MKITSVQFPDDALVAALTKCVAHRCREHDDVPPLNMNEGKGASECGVCAAEAFGTRLAEQAVGMMETGLLHPVLDGYADRLQHHAELKKMLRRARALLDVLQPGAGDFLNEILNA